MVAFSALSLQPVFYAGAIQPGASLYIFDAGTTTARTVYKDQGLTIAHASPILADGGGVLPAIFTSGIAYKARLIAPNGQLIREVDGIPGDVATAVAGGGGGSTSDLVSGDVIWSYMTGPRPNFVRPNGRTIGSAASGASERANADTQALYIWLWTYDTTLAVVGGRGGTALADYNANKPLTLPDFRGRSLRGLDDMGNASAGILAGATFTAGVSTQLGARLGTSAETLAVGQIPGHAHTGTTDLVAGHSHTGTTALSDAALTMTTATAGSHAHAVTGSTNATGDHTHFYSGSTGGQSVGHTHNYSGSNNTAAGGAHNHSYGAARLGASSNGAAPGTITIFNDAAGTTSTAPDHQHSFSWSGTTDGGTDHAHAYSGNTGGANIGNHAHTVSATSDTHTGHTHAVGLVQHSHTIVTDAGGSHSHVVTVGSTGGGGSHNNVGPSVLGTFYMRL